MLLWKEEEKESWLWGRRAGSAGAWESARGGVCADRWRKPVIDRPECPAAAEETNRHRLIYDGGHVWRVPERGFLCVRSLSPLIPALVPAVGRGQTGKVR